jgi:hypothetical protein
MANDVHCLGVRGFGSSAWSLANDISRKHLTMVYMPKYHTVDN